MSIVLSKEQKIAITNRGGNLLVSAAAGAGKTFVLVNRMLDYVERDGFNVDDFLMITFTKAAAAEMKSKIADEVAKRVAENTSNQHLRNQLFRVYQADIKTIDAFCVQVLRENIHLLHVNPEYSYSPDFRVMDEQETILLKNQCIEDALDLFYDELSPNKEHLINTFGYGRDDHALKDIVLDLYNKIQSHPFPEMWMNDIVKQWENIDKDFDRNPYLNYLMDCAVARAKYWSQVLRNAASNIEGNEKVYRALGLNFLDIANQLDQYDKLKNDGWDAMRRIEIKFPKSGTLKEDSSEKLYAHTILEACKQDIGKTSKSNDYFGHIFSVSKEDSLSDLVDMSGAVIELMQLLKTFYFYYQNEKIKRNLMDFSDQEHYALILLTDSDGNKTELSLQIASRYREIMIDEYQDTNAIQDAIFKSLSLKGDNIFVVGDIKQSIYRFRLADPSIFLNKYITYKDAEDANKAEPRKVLLNCNYRSRSEVIDATNYIFKSIMSKECGDIDYSEKEYLRFGQENYIEREDCKVEYHYIIRNKDNEYEELPDRLDTEAIYVAKRIRKLIDEGFQLQNSDGSMRPCDYNDIVILMRSPKNRIKAFRSVLERYGIPTGIDEDGNFFENIEIAIITSLLKIIDNPHQDIPLISVLRSPLFGFNADRIAMIRGLCKSGDMFDALKASKGDDIQYFLDILEDFRAFSRENSVDEVLWYAFSKLSILNIFCAMKNGQQKKKNLLTFYSYAKEQAFNGKRSVYDFISQITRLIESDKAPALSTKQNANGVQIMTIHKSKGLEFPIVILCDLDKKFNLEDLNSKVLFHNQSGLGVLGYNLQKKITFDTVSRRALRNQLELETKSEEMRLLYVAMTRAKEKLILVQCPDHGQIRLEYLAAISCTIQHSESVRMCSSFGDWLLLSILKSRDAKTIYERTDFPLDYLHSIDTNLSIQTLDVHDNDEITVTGHIVNESFNDHIPEIIFDQYPFVKATLIPKKRIATQFKGRVIDETTFEEHEEKIKLSYFENPKFLQKENGLAANEKGTAMHTLMQYIRIYPQELESVKEQVNQLVKRRLLTQMQADSLDLDSVVTFLNSPLAIRISKANKVFREYRFSLLEDAGILNSEMQGEDILLQGIVDLAFIDENGVVIIDFKTDKISAEEEYQRSEYYRGQISLYSHCLSKIWETEISERIIYFFSTNSAVSM